MKKTLTLLMALMAFFAAQAQWMNDPQNNNFIANTSADAGEIYLSTDEVSGDTYVQWCSFGSNGWSPTLQRLNFNGLPQWGNDGIHIGGHNFASWSQGVAMTATSDGGVVSCFANEAGHSYAVRINANGTFAWGEQGVLLFNGQGGSRTEIAAGNDGGVWTLGSDYTNLFLQYVNADGSLNPMVTISDNSGFSCMYGQLTVSNDNRVFVTYEKLGSGYGLYKEKQLWVVGYSPDGTLFSAPTMLMGSQTFQVTYIHSVVPDGIGGGYVYIWHSAIGNSFNTYVFHFNANGASTIIDLNGIPVHSADPNNYYLDAYATVDPSSHDLIIAFQQTDAAFQIECKIFVNRITSSGDRLWNDGKLVLDNGTIPCGGLRVDAYEYDPGFTVIYHKGMTETGTQSIVQAKGCDDKGDVVWTTDMCANAYPKTGDQNSTGFHLGQNILAWVKSSNGGLYGQNIGSDGTMGLIIPPTPPTPCYAPNNFDGRCMNNSGTLGVFVFWEAPEEIPLHYALYRRNISNNEQEKFILDPDVTEYFDEVDLGDYEYWLTAIHENCESDPALTVGGDLVLLIEVTSVDENAAEEIVTVTRIYTLSGQQLRNVSTEDLSKGVYIIQGLTASGKLVNRKMMVD